jgi:hypothetical protein
LDNIANIVNEVQVLGSRFKHFWKHVKNPNMIADLQKELDRALIHFQVCIVVSPDITLSIWCPQLDMMVIAGVDLAEVLVIVKDELEKKGMKPLPLAN